MVVDQRFQRLEDVIGEDELRELLDVYKDLTGSSEEALAGGGR